MEKPFLPGQHQQQKIRKTLVEELNDMEQESPVKRLMEEFPSLKYSTIDRAKLLDFDNG